MFRILEEIIEKSLNCIYDHVSFRHTNLLIMTGAACWPEQSKGNITRGYQKLTAGRNMPAAQSGTASTFLPRRRFRAVEASLDDTPQVSRALRQ